MLCETSTSGPARFADSHTAAARIRAAASGKTAAYSLGVASAPSTGIWIDSVLYPASARAVRSVPITPWSGWTPMPCTTRTLARAPPCSVCNPRNLCPPCPSSQTASPTTRPGTTSSAQRLSRAWSCASDGSAAASRRTVNRSRTIFRSAPSRKEIQRKPGRHDCNPAQHSHPETRPVRPADEIDA